MSQELKCWKLQSRSLKVVVIETWRTTDQKKEAGARGGGGRENKRGEEGRGVWAMCKTLVIVLIHGTGGE